ncbi:translation initiation factor [uncultured Cytophaga sp.]|uniref:translation initiation factor n=1 Tax=uncultured Cytophaga sp. TaxID=160238 RepID=UPI002618F103|nr:translation initiation factor [uncultured Cytophaga sp.]
MAKKEHKGRTGVVYSTSEEFNYSYEGEAEADTLAAENQKLKVVLDSKRRAGKTVTVVSGFIGTTVDLEELGKKLKNKLGVGGSAKDGEILIQGDFKVRIIALLTELKYKVK